ncbi:MAG: phospho-N-acetylmuramoyl-pentapeptide-transferase [Anaeroplasmataceae bacterium]
MILIISFLLSLFLFYIYIKYFKKLSQTEREEGPKTHKIKNGTITMGGIIILLSSLVPFLFYINKFRGLEYLFLILPMVLFFIIGLIDDILIVKFKQNNGLKANLRLLMEVIFSALFYILYLKIYKTNTLNIFSYKINIGFLYGIFICFMYMGVSNACNITDGIDGLMGGIFLISLSTFFIISLRLKKDIITYYTLALIGATLGFLFYNLPRAKVFMGDCGSLMMGASLMTIAIALNMEVYLLLILIIPFLETISVILQVLYFKITKGKRLFKMAPIHHHLELKGYSEVKIITIFYIISIVFSFISIIIYLT